MPEENKKPTLEDLFPDLVNESGKFEIPSSSSLPNPKTETYTANPDGTGSSITLHYDPRSFAATVPIGAAAGAATSKFLPVSTEESRAQQLVSKTGNTMLKNETIMRDVIKRAMDAGVNPREFMSNPDLFQRVMSPVQGYGTKNWVNSEVTNPEMIPPQIQKQIVLKSDMKPLVQEQQQLAERGREVVGATQMRPSGISVPVSRTKEAVQLGQNVGSHEQLLNNAYEAYEVAKQRLADAAKSTRLDKLAEMLHSPLVGGATGALSAVPLTQAWQEAQQGAYKDALIHGLEGLGGLGMAFPHPIAKAVGATALGAGMAGEYAPKIYDYFFPPKK